MTVGTRSWMPSSYDAPVARNPKRQRKPREGPLVRVVANVRL